MTKRRMIGVSMAVLAACAAVAPAQEAAPVEAPAAAPEEPLTATVAAIRGAAQWRATEADPWQMIAVGQTLQEGSELRTNFGSAVQLVLPPDQVITIDRATAIRILRSTFAEGKVQTNVGMKYGRVRYDIAASGREHDAKVTTPNSVLAVRGTKFVAMDEPPFPPTGISIDGLVAFRDARKQTTVGGPGAGKSTVDATTDSPAAFAQQQAIVDPRGTFAGRTDTENILAQSLASFGGSNFADLGVLSFFEQARAGEIEGGVIGVLPVGRQLLVGLIWDGQPNSDVNLTVVSPLGEVVHPGVQMPVASGGVHLGNGVANEAGQGSEFVVWEFQYPRGNYQVEGLLVSGPDAEVTIGVVDGPNTGNPVISALQQKILTSGDPRLVFTVNPEIPTDSIPNLQTDGRSVSASRSLSGAAAQRALRRR